jgi:hypothetical protein
MSDLPRCPECAHFAAVDCLVNALCQPAGQRTSPHPRRCRAFVPAEPDELARRRRQAAADRPRPTLSELIQQAKDAPDPAGPCCETCGSFSWAAQCSSRLGRCEWRDGQLRGTWERCPFYWRDIPKLRVLRH